MIVTSSIAFLPCADIRRTVDFYHGLLGLPVAQAQGDNLYIFDTGYGFWGFCQYADGRPPLSGAQGVCLSLNLESREAVDAACARLRGRCRVHKEPAQHPDFPVYSCFVLDPDGYLVEFQKLNDPEGSMERGKMEI